MIKLFSSIGDIRSAEHVGLAALHIVFLREHNRVARGLKAINPAWDDEKLFQVRLRNQLYFLLYLSLKRRVSDFECRNPSIVELETCF